MRLAEIAMVDAPHYKGQSQTPDVVPDNAWEIRTEELADHIKGWQKLYDKLPDKTTAYAYQVEYRINDMIQELKDFDEIGEIPFTFYAAKERSDAEFFSDQFSDGEVREVGVSAKNLASVEDLRALGFLKSSVSHLQPMMIHKLKKAGFDGATGTIDRLHGTEVVVFSPEQVKVI